MPGTYHNMNVVLAREFTGLLHSKRVLFKGIKDGEKLLHGFLCAWSLYAHPLSFYFNGRTAIICDDHIQWEGHVCVVINEGSWEGICYQILSFVLNSKLGEIGSGKNSAVLVVFLLVSLVMDKSEY